MPAQKRSGGKLGTVAATSRSHNAATSRSHKGWFVYMLECESGAIYTGVAVDVHARFALHCSGKGAKYTRANKPLRILGMKRCRGKGPALSAEFALKQLTPGEKWAWAKANTPPSLRAQQASAGRRK